MTFPTRALSWLTLVLAWAAPVLVLGCRSEGAPCAPGPAAPAVSLAPLGVVGLGRIVPGQRVLHLAAPGAVTGSTGVVKLLRVQRNDWVRQGQVLAWTLDHDPAAAALVQAGREVEVASRLLVQARAGEKAGTLAAQQAQAGHSQTDG